MKKTLKRSVTHGLAVALGMLLASRGLSPGHEERGVEAEAGGVRAMPPASLPDRTPGSIYDKFSSKGFPARWQEISERRISTCERQGSQRELLKEWARVDLAGALQAAVAEGFPVVAGLTEAFEEVFRERAMEAWGIIGTDAVLGLSTEMLRREWAEVVAKSDPAVVMAVAGQLQPDLRQRVLETVFGKIFMVAEMPVAERLRLLEVLAAGDDAQAADGRLSAALKLWVDPGEQIDMALPALRQRWEGAAGPARRVGMAIWIRGLAEAEPEAFSRAWQGVPEGDRGEALRVALESFTRESPAITGLLDQVVAAGQWDYLREHGAEKMSHEADFAGDIDFHALADWARTLPARPETVNLYRAAVDGWLTDEARAVAWLERMPAGDWHREQGYAALAQNALNAANEELLAKAIAAITDPALKKEAQGNWDRARGR